MCLVYAPNDSKARVRLWTGLKSLLEGTKSMVLGDFNTTLNQEDWPYAKRGIGQEEQSALADLERVCGLLDTTTIDQTDEAKLFTWHNKRGGRSGMEINAIGKMLLHPRCMEVYNQLPVLLRFELAKWVSTYEGPIRFKLNTTHPKDYCETITTAW